jgi:hypothetical protein
MNLRQKNRDYFRKSCELIESTGAFSFLIPFLSFASCSPTGFQATNKGESRKVEQINSPAPAPVPPAPLAESSDKVQPNVQPSAVPVPSVGPFKIKCEEGESQLGDWCVFDKPGHLINFLPHALYRCRGLDEKGDEVTDANLCNKYAPNNTGTYTFTPLKFRCMQPDGNCKKNAN